MYLATVSQSVRGSINPGSQTERGSAYQASQPVRGGSLQLGQPERGITFQPNHPLRGSIDQSSQPVRGSTYATSQRVRGSLHQASQPVRGRSYQHSQSRRGRIYRGFRSVRGSRYIQPRRGGFNGNRETPQDVTGSRERTCGICQDVVMDKPWSKARFGILPSCPHCYCLSCIMTWRRTQTEGITDTVNKTCPECRQRSDYVCPSRVWIEDPADKERFLAEYREQCGEKDCWYFKRGAGQCYLGNQCFFRHLDREGNPVDLGPPRIRGRRVPSEEMFLEFPEDYYEMFPNYTNSGWTYNDQVLQGLNFFEYVPGVVWDEHSPLVTNMWESANNLWG